MRWLPVLVVVLGAGALVRPAPVADVEPPSRPTAFRWDADLLFRELEDEFLAIGEMDGSELAASFQRIAAEAHTLRSRVAEAPSPDHEALWTLANLHFRLAVRGAASPELLPRVADVFDETRRVVMSAAVRWPSDRPTHESLYRLLFGSRIALDEALVQAGLGALPALRVVEEVASRTPSIVVEGLRVHSGDLLLSRGGAPTSALIARGNDFPNTFSHVALAHVDAETGEATVVESLIEAGSVLTSVDEYLEAKKHRIVVLRLRPDHPAVVADPLVAHRAAEAAITRVRNEHIPYDFAMAWRDPDAAFCSETVYHPYRANDVELWAYRSAMTAPGLVRWLGAMGVREFTTLVPSDLEYDPQLRVVAEWRDAPALLDFRLDNAVIDVLLEEAERGADFGYPWYALPAARLLKGYSVGQSMVGARPTIPQGMSAAAALRVNALVGTVHPTLKADLEARAAAFQDERGYAPPYWELVGLARASLDASRTTLAPALAGG